MRLIRAREGGKKATHGENAESAIKTVCKEMVTLVYGDEEVAAI